MNTLALIALAMAAATLLGGVLALRLRDNLHLILGFSAGAVVGVAFFDLLPEALELAGENFDPSTVLAVTALGFLCYLALDRLILFHGHDHEHTEDSHRGYFGAGAISFHSFLDGVGVGFAFQVSPAVGAVVALAVLAHNFSDGINTVGLAIRGGANRAKAFKWLIADALAPALGIAVTLFFSIPATTLALFLALFAGFFLYLGASDLIPESHHAHPVRWTTVSTILGVIVLFAVIKLAGI
jgi:zinc transporter ZupT